MMWLMFASLMVGCVAMILVLAYRDLKAAAMKKLDAVCKEDCEVIKQQQSQMNVALTEVDRLRTAVSDQGVAYRRDLAAKDKEIHAMQTQLDLGQAKRREDAAEIERLGGVIVAKDEAIRYQMEQHKKVTAENSRSQTVLSHVKNMCLAYLNEAHHLGEDANAGTVTEEGRKTEDRKRRLDHGRGREGGQGPHRDRGPSGD